MHCSPPGSCVHGISQAGILAWVAGSSSRESSRPRLPLAGGFFTADPPGKPGNVVLNHLGVRHFTSSYFPTELHPSAPRPGENSAWLLEAFQVPASGMKQGPHHPASLLASPPHPASLSREPPSPPGLQLGLSHCLLDHQGLQITCPATAPEAKPFHFLPE